MVVRKYNRVLDFRLCKLNTPYVLHGSLDHQKNRHEIFFLRIAVLSAGIEVKL